MTDALDAHLSDDQRALLERTAALARDVLAQIAAAGEPGRVNRPLIAAMSEHGLLARLFGTTAPAAGGSAPAATAVDLCLIREGLARHCTEAETAFAVQGLGASPILASPLADEWRPRLASGQAVAAFALTEPGAGSDVASLALRAERDGDHFLLTGEKAWISNAPEADVYTVFARTSDAGARGITAFAVPRDADGLSGEPIALIAPHPIGRLRFDRVPVPADHVLGEVDRGFAVAMGTLDRFRPSVGAFAVGMARAALDLAVAHAATREAFGQPLARFQAVSHRLADVATRVQAARLLVFQAATAYDRGLQPVSHVAAMAKLLATETAQEAVDAAVQVHGAAALEASHKLAHLYAEVRAPRIYEGASEIQREIIGRALFAGRS